MLHGKGGPLAQLKNKGFRVPEFIIVSHEDFISWGDAHLYSQLQNALSSNDQGIIYSSAKAFVESVFIPDLQLDEDKLYAVRSSAQLEDSSDHSFAGIFQTKLFASSSFLASPIKDVWLSLYEDKSYQYCQAQNILWASLKMDVIVQEMIVGDKSGILFQSNPIGKPQEQVIVAGFGLCQGIVNEQADTDTYLINGHEVTESHILEKTNFLNWKDGVISLEKIPHDKKTISVLTHSEIEKLLTLSLKLKSHSKEPLDVEFTFKGNDLYILQSRPISSESSVNTTRLNIKNIPEINGPLRGIPCSQGEVEAECEVITTPQETSSLAGKILVSEKTDGAWEYFFEGISGIITEKGSMLSHAAIISRELGIPCIVNVKDATHILKSGMRVKMNGATGEISFLT